MHEIAPGIHHWTALHEPINSRVSSYYVADAAIVIDPKLPDDGWGALPGEPTQIVLTSGHHLRDAHTFARRFGIPIRGLAQVAEHVGDAAEIEIVGEGDEVAPGVTALHIGVLCPDEGALHILAGGGALAIADGVTPREGGLGFFSDSLLGDDPAAIKRGLKQAYAKLLDRDFAHLLFAHGEPVVGTGKTDLDAFVSSSAGE